MNTPRVTIDLTDPATIAEITGEYDGPHRPGCDAPGCGRAATLVCTGPGQWFACPEHAEGARSTEPIVPWLKAAERAAAPNPERDRAVEVLGEELDRLLPVDERFDFRSLVPASAAELPSRAEWERKQAELERAQRLHDSGVEVALTEQDLEWLVRDGVPPDPSSALRSVWRWEQARRNGRADFAVLVLLGLKGRGKTLAGGWLLAHYGPGVYCTAEQLRASMKAAYGPERDLYRRALRTRVLFVDELGRETEAESADAMLFDVVNSRRGRPPVRGDSKLRYQRWTLLAGNLSERDLRARYDESTVDRIEQQGVILTAKGDNRRVRLIDQIKRDRGAP